MRSFSSAVESAAVAGCPAGAIRRPSSTAPPAVLAFACDGFIGWYASFSAARRCLFPEDALAASRLRAALPHPRLRSPRGRSVDLYGAPPAGVGGGLLRLARSGPCRLHREDRPGHRAAGRALPHHT